MIQTSNIVFTHVNVSRYKIDQHIYLFFLADQIMSYDKLINGIQLILLPIMELWLKKTASCHWSINNGIQFERGDSIENSQEKGKAYPLMRAIRKSSRHASQFTNDNPTMHVIPWVITLGCSRISKPDQSHSHVTEGSIGQSVYHHRKQVHSSSSSFLREKTVPLSETESPKRTHTKRQLHGYFLSASIYGLTHTRTCSTSYAKNHKPMVTPCMHTRI